MIYDPEYHGIDIQFTPLYTSVSWVGKEKSYSETQSQVSAGWQGSVATPRVSACSRYWCWCPKSCRKTICDCSGNRKDMNFSCVNSLNLLINSWSEGYQSYILQWRTEAEKFNNLPQDVWVLLKLAFISMSGYETANPICKQFFKAQAELKDMVCFGMCTHTQRIYHP